MNSGRRQKDGMRSLNVPYHVRRGGEVSFSEPRIISIVHHETDYTCWTLETKELLMVRWHNPATGGFEPCTSQKTKDATVRHLLLESSPLP